MSYIVPSVQVYQQLANNGGVANTTPDLESVIIGVCNNVVTYDPSTAATLATSQASNISGAPAALVDGVELNAYLGSTKVGQIVNPDSVKVYIGQAQVETKLASFTVSPGTSVLNTSATLGLTGHTVAITANSAVVHLSAGNAAGVNLNDYIKVPGAGVAGADLEAYVIATDGAAGLTFTLSTRAATTVSGATAVRTGFHNLNDVTSTTRVNIGDVVEIPTNVGSVITKVYSIAAVGDKVVSINVVDLLPSSVTMTDVVVKLRKVYSSLSLPEVFGANINYGLANVASLGLIDLSSSLLCTYGRVAYGTVYIAYTAIRQDLLDQIIDIPTVTDLIATLGSPTEQNPLALGVELALANTTTSIKAIAVASDDLIGYERALELAATTRLYCITPLTQDISILTAVQQHVEQLSTPEHAFWRMALVNTDIPSRIPIGVYNANSVNTNASITLITEGVPGTPYKLQANNATFIADGVVPGDTVNLTSYSPATPTNASLTVLEVISNQELYVSAPSGNLTSVDYWVSRSLSKAQQATYIAQTSASFASGRVTHVQPNLCGVSVNKVVKYLPGYYLCCALAGLVCGLPAQKGLTNIGVAGITDLKNSNFYFTTAQLNTIAGAGTLILAQQTQGGLPYVRHSITTDMSVLQYREIQQVKNIDFLSYFFHDILQGFPGRYNITPDTLQILRTTITAGAKLLQGQVLPKIGPPLLTFNIQTLEQDPDNKDHVRVRLPVTIPTVMNYIDLYLIV